MITSAKTARNMLPALFRKVDAVGGWQEGNRNLDYGGGPYDKMTAALEERGVVNMVFDPHHKTIKHNLMVATNCSSRAVNTITISNVLNVIRSPQERMGVLTCCRDFLKKGGRCYITVYEKDGSGRGRKTRDGWQANRKLSSYRREAKMVFRNVEIENNLMICY